MVLCMAPEEKTKTDAEQPVLNEKELVLGDVAVARDEPLAQVNVDGEVIHLGNTPHEKRSIQSGGDSRKADLLGSHGEWTLDLTSGRR